MDPVFADPFEEGTVVSCRRAIDVGALPDVDILVVHTVIRSLRRGVSRRVARDVEAHLPPDPLIVHALRELEPRTSRRWRRWRRSSSPTSSLPDPL